MSRSDISILKSQLSRTHDEARLAYGRSTTKVPRQYVAIGTTNPAGEYLRDPTGNRRFLPVTIREFDLAAFTRDRDQLWAEAAAMERAGVSIRLDPSLYGAASDEQEERTTVDAIDLIVGEAFGDYVGKMRVSDAWLVLGIKDRPLTDQEMTRFGIAMRRTGWSRGRVRGNDGKLTYVYRRGNEGETERWITVTGIGSTAVVRPGL
jgi:predicted P-loop ATPase